MCNYIWSPSRRGGFFSRENNVTVWRERNGYFLSWEKKFQQNKTKTPATVTANSPGAGIAHALFLILFSKEAGQIK